MSLNHKFLECPGLEGSSSPTPGLQRTTPRITPCVWECLDSVSKAGNDSRSPKSFTISQPFLLPSVLCIVLVFRQSGALQYSTNWLTKAFPKHRKSSIQVWKAQGWGTVRDGIPAACVSHGTKTAPSGISSLAMNDSLGAPPRSWICSFPAQLSFVSYSHLFWSTQPTQQKVKELPAPWIIPSYSKTPTWKQRVKIKLNYDFLQ